MTDIALMKQKQTQMGYMAEAARLAIEDYKAGSIDWQGVRVARRNLVIAAEELTQANRLAIRSSISHLLKEMGGY